MNVRSWAVAAVSTAAVVAGVVVVQSGVAGTAALPILPHRAAAPASGTELPTPAEVRSAISAPPSAGAVQQAPVSRPAAVPGQASADQRRPAADRHENRPSGKESRDRPGDGGGHDGSGATSGKNPGKNSGPGSGPSSGHDSGHDSHGGDGQG